jgi:hypothetical protein
MKLLHKFALSLVAVAGLALATPAQARWFPFPPFFLPRAVHVVLPYPVYYAPAYYGYYGPGPYYAPYYGGRVVYSVGGRGYWRGGYWYRR